MTTYSEAAILNDMSDMLTARYGRDLCDLKKKLGTRAGGHVSMTFVLEGHIPSDGPNTVRRSSFVITPGANDEVEVIASLSVDHDDDNGGEGGPCDCSFCRDERNAAA